MKIPKIQSTIRASQIVSPELMSAEAESEQEIIQEDILEDIYNILYTPVNKIGKESDNLNFNKSNSIENGRK